MSSRESRLTRRSALKGWAAAGIAFPYVMKAHATAPSCETLYHASFGAAGMAKADIESLTASPHVKLVAVADVDKRSLDRIKDRFPGVKLYQDWRELLDKEKSLNSVNVSTPDHMHASITMRSLQQGLHVYSTWPITTIQASGENGSTLAPVLSATWDVKSSIVATRRPRYNIPTRMTSHERQGRLRS